MHIHNVHYDSLCKVPYLNMGVVLYIDLAPDHVVGSLYRQWDIQAA